MGGAERVPARPSALVGTLKFLVLAVAVAAAVAAAGYLPTRIWGGEAAVAAMLAGCAIAVVASVLGALPLALAAGAAPEQRVSLALAAMVVRLLAALALGAAVAWSGRFVTKPLIVWLAISYLVLLVVDTLYAVRALKGVPAGEGH